MFEGLAQAGPSHNLNAFLNARAPLAPRGSCKSRAPAFQRDYRANLLESERDLLAAHRMYMFPADEQRISDVERGRSCRAVVPLPVGAALAVGDTILFALSQSNPGQPPAYVKEGDCVVVALTEVTSLASRDPVSGQELIQIAWNPLGQNGTPAKLARRVGKKPRATSQNSPETV